MQRTSLQHEMAGLLAIERAGRLRRVGEVREEADDVHRIEFERTEEG